MQVAVAAVLSVGGVVAAALAVANERRMQRHRLPGVSYVAATFRRDGGWRRADLFAPAGLVFQRQAAQFGLVAAVLWVAALLTWVTLAGR